MEKTQNTVLVGRRTCVAISLVYFPSSLINSLISISLFRRPPSLTAPLTAVPPLPSRSLTQSRTCFLCNYFIGSDRSSSGKVISIHPSIFWFLIQVIFYSFNRDTIHSEASRWEPQPRRRFRPPSVSASWGAAATRKARWKSCPVQVSLVPYSSHRAPSV